MSLLSTTINLLLFIGLTKQIDIYAQLNNTSKESIWLYECQQDEFCVRKRQVFPSEPYNVSYEYPNVDMCRTFCNKYGGLWPRPTSAYLNKTAVAIRPDQIRFDTTKVPEQAQQMIEKMKTLAIENMMLECKGQHLEDVNTTVLVNLSVESQNISLTWETDEKYTLEIETRGNEVTVNIQADSVYGARHALETLSQLVSSRQLIKDQTTCGFHLVSAGRVKDLPVYTHRGLLLDTARHFIPIRSIKKNLDGMAAVKMNVFHWHITDSQSFPLESKRVPQFTKYGAYSGSEIYSVEEVKDLIDYARVRGIRVVIEIDSPAHAGNGWQWGEEHGYGKLAVCVNAENWADLCLQPPCGQLNPANPNMYHFLRLLYADIAEILPKPALFHLGGDEVFTPCWNSSEEIQRYMELKGFNLDREGFMRLWAKFLINALKMWDDELNKVDPDAGQAPVLLWSSEITQVDNIERYLSKKRYKDKQSDNVTLADFVPVILTIHVQSEFVIQVWENDDSQLIDDLIKLGYKVISIPRNVWYLDYGLWGTTSYSNWRRMYNYVLPNSHNVMGGEVTMWSEYVDEHGLDTRIWPRAAAVAERLWTNPATTFTRISMEAVTPRMERIRSRLVTRGINADVIAPRWCQQNDAKCT